MGKCIVCNKSAGPFYSLHKACYQVYEDTRECLRQVFSKSIEFSTQADEFVNALNDCRPSSSFSSSLFDSLIKRIWQEQANKIIKGKSLNAEHANYLLNLAPVLEIEDKDVEQYLFTKLSNLEHLVNINQRQPISKSFTGIHQLIDMVNDESLIWVFEETLMMKRKISYENKKWTEFQSIVNNLFKKSRYKKLEVMVEAVGKLAITSQNIYFITEKEMIKVNYADIYDITPMQDGVRIQTTQRDSTPNTYITGDGCFIYTLLRYAQDQKLER